MLLIASVLKSAYLFLGNAIGAKEDRSNTTTTNSVSSKRSRMSSSATNTSNISCSQPSKSTHRTNFATKGGNNINNDTRNSTENPQPSKQTLNGPIQSSTATAILHEKLPNGVCSCGATGQFMPPSQNPLVHLAPPNQNNAQAPRSMAPPAAHSNQRPQIHQQNQVKQRQQRHMSLQQQHQQQLMQQQWALSAHHRQRWSSSMVCCPPPLPAPPPPISGQPTFPTSHYWNELAPAVTTSSNTSSFQAPRQCRQSASTSNTNNKRSLRSQQQQNQNDQQYAQNGNQNVTSSDTNVGSNGWIIGGPNYHQQQTQHHWLQQRYLQHQQNYHNLHQNHLAHQQLQQQAQQNIPLVPHLLQHTQSLHPLPPNNNNSLCRGCAEGKCPSALSSASGPSSLVALQRQSAMIQMQASGGSSKSSF